MRWLAVDEDDGQIARELVPVDKAFMHREEEEEEDEEGGAPSSATLGLEQKGPTHTHTGASIIQSPDNTHIRTECTYSTHTDKDFVTVLLVSCGNSVGFECGP